MPSSHLILCPPLLLPSILPSIRVFSNESVLHIRWPKYWSFNFSISPSSEYSGLIFFRVDWLDLLAVQETLKSLLQHHSSKTSILQCSAFFIVQLWHPYMTTGKAIALTRWTVVGKVMSLLFNMLSRLVIAFLPRSKRLFISWLQSPSAVIFESKKIKSLTVSGASSSISHEVIGPDAMILVFWMYRVLSQLFHSPLSLSSRGSLVLLHFLLWRWCHLRIWGYDNLLLTILIPACVSPSLAFCMMYSAYKLNKQVDSTLFPIWNQSLVPCPVLTVVSWPASNLCLRH